MRNDQMLTEALEILRAAHKDGPEAFERDAAEHMIELVAKSCRAYEASKPLIQNPADRRDHFKRLADALAAARAELEKTVGSIQLRGDLQSVWRSLAPKHGLISNMLEGISALETAAREATQKNRRKRGEHGSPEGKAIPPHAIEQLEMVYRNSTRRDPKTTAEGPFHRFVLACLAAFGYDVDNRDQRVLKLIKAARRRSMPTPGTSVRIIQRPTAE
jgi:hypothetical protein